MLVSGIFTLFDDKIRVSVCAKSKEALNWCFVHLFGGVASCMFANVNFWHDEKGCFKKTEWVDCLDSIVGIIFTLVTFGHRHVRFKNQNVDKETLGRMTTWVTIYFHYMKIHNLSNVTWWLTLSVSNHLPNIYFLCLMEEKSNIGLKTSVPDILFIDELSL